LGTWGGRSGFTGERVSGVWQVLSRETMLASLAHRHVGVRDGQVLDGFFASFRSEWARVGAPCSVEIISMHTIYLPWVHLLVITTKFTSSISKYSLCFKI
jgi:hypothetical protein